MAKDVAVHFIWRHGEKLFPKVDQVLRRDGCLDLLVKKYPALGGDNTMKHVASIPFTSILWWEESEV